MKTVTNFDVEGLNKLTVEDVDLFYLLGNESEDLTEEEKEIYAENYTTYFKETNSKLDYEISTVDEDAKTVEIKCKYIDASEFIKQLFVQTLTNVMSGLYSESGTEEEDIEKTKDMIKQMFKTAKEAVKEDTYKEETITLKFEEVDKELKVKEMDETVKNMIVANCLKAQQEMDDSLNFSTDLSGATLYDPDGNLVTQVPEDENTFDNENTSDDIENTVPANTDNASKSEGNVNYTRSDNYYGFVVNGNF